METRAIWFQPVGWSICVHRRRSRTPLAGRHRGLSGGPRRLPEPRPTDRRPGQAVGRSRCEADNRIVCADSPSNPASRRPNRRAGGELPGGRNCVQSRNQVQHQPQHRLESLLKRAGVSTRQPGASSPTTKSMGQSRCTTRGYPKPMLLLSSMSTRVPSTPSSNERNTSSSKRHQPVERTIYGYMGFASQPLVRTLITSWSLAQYVYGDLGNTDNFVESFYYSVPNHPHCNTYPNGQFSYPHYAINGGSYFSPGGALAGGAVGKDDVPNNSAYPQCGRTFMNSWTVTTQWLVPA